jgi:HprK-related kinase A
MFEWGLNWVVANHAHHYLIIHSAVLEKNGKTLIFPGSPGSGKSTLCAGLVTQGWRLLSDEMALLSLKNGLLTPIPRPISLKNQSIDIIKQIPGDFFIGPAVHDTAKGTVAHMSAPRSSVERGDEQATPTAVIFPKYKAGAETNLSPISKGRTFLALAENSFNYHVLGSTAFSALTTMIDQCQCYNFTYQHLESAYETMDQVING